MITVPAVRREGLFIETTRVPDRVIKIVQENYAHRFYDEKSCEKCEYVVDRHSTEYCDPCSAYIDHVRLAHLVKVNGKQYLKTPLGVEPRTKNALRKYGIKLSVRDRQVRGRKYPLRFIGKLRDYQEGATESLLRHKRGVLQSGARTGKTVMAAHAVCEVGRKTLIIASQREWVLGFRDTFIGSKTTPRMTNIPKSKIKLCRKYEDFESSIVALATYQTFISPAGQKLLKRIQHMFDVIVIDEVHKSPAYHFLRTVGSFSAEYVWGLTATPNRKDGRYRLARAVLGPVVHQTKRKSLQPIWSMVMTEFRDNRGGMWPHLVGRMEKDPKRLELIAKWALKDMKAGHIVMIPLAHKVPIVALTTAINKIAGREVAEFIHGDVKQKVRDDYLARAQAGKIKIIVGTLSILQTGTNIPPASALYEVTLSSNNENAEQRISRVLTPHDGKLPPIVRVFCDATKVRRRTLANEWFGKIKNHFRPIMSEKQEQEWLDYLHDRKRGSTSGRGLLGW